MKIGFDCRFLLKNNRGMSKVLLSILDELAKIKKKEMLDIYLYFDKKIPESMRKEFESKGFNIIEIHCKYYFLWEQFILPIKIKEKLDCFIFMFNTGSIYFKPARKVYAYIHDVIYMKSFKEVPMSKVWYQNMGRIYRRVIVPRFAKKSDLIFTISEFSKKDIIKELGSSSEKINVIYNGADLKSNYDDNIIKKYNLKEFFLILGATDLRKNTALSIKSFKKYIDKYDDTETKLVISGIEDISHSEYDNLIKMLGLEERVISVGFVSDSELNSLYRSARVFLFLSSYEGFGLPLIESMYNETPIVALNATCIPEIICNSGLIVEDNEAEIADALNKINSDNNIREQLILQGKNRVKNFSWKKSVEKIITILQKTNNLKE